MPNSGEKMVAIGPITSLHYAANGNFVNGVYAPAADGFNLADVSSVSLLNSLPSGVKGLVYLGMSGGVTQAFKTAVNAYIGNPNLYGFYMVDEPTASATIAANLKAEVAYIKSIMPQAVTFMVEQNLSATTTPSFYYTPANTGIDLFGLDPYPVQTNVPNNLDYNIIPAAVAAAESAGISLAQIVPIYQAFGGGQYSSYILPTADQAATILSTWAAYVPTPAFDYAYSWGTQVGDTALSTDPSLAAVFAQHNMDGGAFASAALAAPTFTNPTGVDTTSTTPTISGTGLVGDLVTLAIDGVVVSVTITVDSNSAWSYTPTAPLANNATHELAAIQIAPDGSASAIATDVFSVAIPTSAPAPKVLSVVSSPANADLGAGQSVTLTVTMSDAVQITGTPQFNLNDGGIATYDAAHSTPTVLVFDYTVQAGQNTPDLAVSSFDLNGGSIANLAGAAANLSGAVTNPAGTLQVDTTAPSSTVKSISGGSHPTISGTTESGSSLVVSYLDLANGHNGSLGSTTASSNGTWSLTPSSAWYNINDPVKFAVTATDRAGNVGVTNDFFGTTGANGFSNTAGNDYFVGDGGNDAFNFQGNTIGGNGNDIIADFGAHSLAGSRQADVIQFDSSIFQGSFSALLANTHNNAAGYAMITYESGGITSTLTLNGVHAAQLTAADFRL
jgi:hypothetical protein